MTVDLPTHLLEKLALDPETGMGYQIVSIALRDGTRFEQVVVTEGKVMKVRGLSDVPFSTDQIAKVELTHAKWNFNAS